MPLCAWVSAAYSSRMRFRARCWFRAALVFTLTLVLFTAALGDDTTATIGIGGLQFQHSRQIRMLSEDLYISPTRVRIHFTFMNVSTRPIETVIAFPLPNLDQAEWYNTSIGSTTGDPVNFIGFKTIVDGEPVGLKVERRAFNRRGRDVTRLLRRYHVPLNPMVRAGGDPLKALPTLTVRALVDAHLLSDSSEKMPMWSVSTRFWWRQKFEPGKTITIDQSYQPITGEYYDYRVGNEVRALSALKNDIHADVCPNASTFAALKRKFAATPVCKTGLCKDSYIHFYTTEYVLTTGNNWDGPIGTFHLILDKLKPANILSTCWHGPLAQTGPTTFESTLRNFSPRNDIKILVVQ